MISARGLSSRATVHGRYDHRKDLPAIAARNHVFIHTSRFEGGPCFALMELLQAGRFVIASPVGGIPDIYDGRPEIGRLVPPHDPVAIASALDNALDHIGKGLFDPSQPRRTYADHFAEPHAHAQFMSALGLGAC